ncbi:uncharacterized protein LOC125679140 [Ostrea edulis]|uniref:uncharacterized protein LOC125679140 n=1 Tax=Ostrea edulis TaxID=37623 RepID=UPI0024AEFE60|nr:uncharacterized protein LOC125679140 [Ostrea edulis]
MIGCEERRTASAEFADQIFCLDAVEWSEDNRISVCTERGIIIMEMNNSPLQLDKNIHYNKSLVPRPKDSNNVTRLPIEVFKSWKMESSSFSEDEVQELFLDHPLHPYLKGQVLCLGYVRAHWSARGVDTMGRCALAAVTGDHRLNIYVKGNDKKKWKEVIDMQSLLFERFKDRVSEEMKFSEFKEVCYNMFVVDVAWSPLCNFDDVKYCILAVAMKSGAIHLLKILTPLCSKSDVVVVSETQPLSSIPSTLCWCPGTSNEKDGLVVGYQSGQVIYLSVDKRQVTTKSTTVIHEEEDLIRVGCIAWKLMSEDSLLFVVSKDIHILSFVINSKTAAVTKRTSHLGLHDFPVTGLFVTEDSFVMSSEEGQLQICRPSLNGEDIELLFSTLTTDFVGMRKILGASSSPNGIFVLIATWPMKKFDLKFMRRSPMHVFTLRLKSEEDQRKTAEKLLLDETVPMDHIPDILEYFRQSLWSGVNIIPSLTSFVSQSHKWFSMPIKLLRVLRYFIMTIQLHIPETTDEGIKEAALAKGTVSQLSNVILLKHVEKVFCGVLRSQQKQFTETEVKVLSTILNWLDGKEEKLANDKVEEVNQLITKKEFEDCCICHSVLKEEEMTLVCPNGHVFGMCCLTFLPCSAAYRTCVSCNTLASSSEKLKDISWLPKDECSLCGGILL